MTEQPYNIQADFDSQQELEGFGVNLGNTFAKTTHQFGFRVYASGVDGTTAFFAAPIGKQFEKEQDAAYRDAVKFAADHGYEEFNADGQPNLRIGYQMSIHRDDAVVIRKEGDAFVAQGATWASNLYETIPYWPYTQKDKDTDEYKPSAFRHLLMPFLTKHGLKHGSVVWARLGKRADPYKLSLGEAGKTETFNNEPSYPTVWVVTETYASKDEMQKAAKDAAGSAIVGGSNSSVPPDYTPKMWENVSKGIKADLMSGMSVDDAATEYEIDVKYIESLAV